MLCSVPSTISEKTEVFRIDYHDQLSVHKNLCESTKCWWSKGKDRTGLVGVVYKRNLGNGPALLKY